MNRRPSPVRFLSADDAAALVADGDTVAVSGCLFNLVPEALCAALERRFLASHRPRGLTLCHLNIFGMLPGTGIDRFAHPGLTTRMVGSSYPAFPWAAESRTTRMILANELEAIALPAGVIAENFRATGSGRPGLSTQVGLETFVDPRQRGGRLNDWKGGPRWDGVSLFEQGGGVALHFERQPIQVSFILGSAADREGNVTFEDEPLHQSAVAQAMATRASGGIVIVQVQRVVPAGALDARLVKLPALLTDVIVEEPRQESFAYGVHAGGAAFTGARREPEPEVPLPPLSPDTYAARRAFAEIHPGDTVNLGAGLPVSEMPALLAHSGLKGRVHLSIDHGSLGGTNLGGLLTATHWNPTALLDSNQVYEYYAGTGLDIAFLGAAEIDGRGDVNVARAGPVTPGIGGFMDIVEAARTVVICTTLRRGKLDVAFDDGRLRIVREGARAKFVERVELVCLCAARAARQGKRLLYVTERAVFTWQDGGLHLIEIAPGLEPGQLRQAMDCGFTVAPQLRTLPAHIFHPQEKTTGDPTCR